MIVALLGWGAIDQPEAVAEKHLAIARIMPRLATGFAMKCSIDKDAKFTVELVAPDTQQDIAAC